MSENELPTVKTVPNNFPLYKAQPYKLAIVGEAPGADEEYFGQPFVGESGKLLWAEAGKAGIVRDACFVGNICQHRPPKNMISLFDWDGPEITEGIEKLENDLNLFDPNLILLLGNSALRWAKRHPEQILKWRGSLFLAPNGWKCMASIHPAAVLREYGFKSDLARDLKVARKEAEKSELVLPERNLITNLSTAEIIQRLQWIREHKITTSIDIEGYVYNMWCISVAISPVDSFLISFKPETALWRAVAQFLSDPSCPKILQNGCYDSVVLQFGHQIPVRGIVDDTMLMFWELFCEKRMALWYQASVCTGEPYWKDDRESDDQETKDRYCCLDSAVTYEIRDTLLKQLSGPQLANYRFNMALQEPLLYIQNHGLAYDQAKANEMLAEAKDKIHRLQFALDSIAFGVGPRTKEEWLELAQRSLCFVKSQGKQITIQQLKEHSKITNLQETLRVEEILSKNDKLSLADQGELGMLCDISVNVESSKQIGDFLYRQLGLPVQYQKVKGRLTTNETTDLLALLDLYRKTKDPTLKLILAIRSWRGRCETLEAKTDKDGRLRCSYNQLKKEKGTGGPTSTGRLSCSKFLTGSGYNLQTTTRKQRKLFLADEGFWFAQMDLSGADGWTVAAHCNQAGDSTMLEDYRFGLKPANIIALMYQESTASRLSRDILKFKSKEVDKDGWLYFACKRVQHGTNYGMKAKTMTDQILQDSYKLFGEPVVVPFSVCDHLQTLYLQRYPGIKVWHSKVKTQLMTKGYLISASGHKRIFFGRKNDYDTFKKALAEEPQNNTSYATNLALSKLWADTENRYDKETLTHCRQTLPDGRVQLRIQPLHQVHDALLVQFRKERTEWAKERIRYYFDNQLTIAGQQITIPYEGSYGRSWGELTEGKI